MFASAGLCCDGGSLVNRSESTVDASCLLRLADHPTIFPVGLLFAAWHKGDVRHFVFFVYQECDCIAFG